MKKVLVIGGSGALGKEIVKYILSLREYNVYISTKNLHVPGCITCNVKDVKQIFKILANIDPHFIIHLAANYSDVFDEAYQVNVQSTKHILEYIKDHNKSTKLLIIGSAAEYGMVHYHENPISEKQRLNPFSVYGVTKAWQTLLMGMYVNSGINVVCARIFNLYGDDLDGRLFVGFLNRQIIRILSGESDKIDVGNLSHVRDYISVSKAAQQIVAVLLYGEPGEIYHIASGVPVVLRDFAINLLRLKGLGSTILNERVDFFHTQKRDFPIIYANIEKTLLLTDNLIT